MARVKNIENAEIVRVPNKMTLDGNNVKNIFTIVLSIITIISTVVAASFYISSVDYTTKSHTKDISDLKLITLTKKDEEKYTLQFTELVKDVNDIKTHLSLMEAEQAKIRTDVSVILKEIQYINQKEKK